MDVLKKISRQNVGFEKNQAIFHNPQGLKTLKFSFKSRGTPGSINSCWIYDLG